MAGGQRKVIRRYASKNDPGHPMQTGVYVYYLGNYAVVFCLDSVTLLGDHVSGVLFFLL